MINYEAMRKEAANGGMAETMHKSALREVKSLESELSATLDLCYSMTNRHEMNTTTVAAIKSKLADALKIAKGL